MKGVNDVIKKAVKKKDYEFLSHEMHYLETTGVISSEEKEKILNTYEIKTGSNFIQTVLTIGALLLGIGVLSFVASNWMYFHKGIKFFLIIFGIIGFQQAGLRLEATYPKTARSLHYIGLLIFGAGIFLVEQMFNLSINFNTSFLLWALGTILIGYYSKDVIILLFTTLLLFIYINGSMFLDETAYPFAVLIFLPVLYWMLKEFRFPKRFTFSLNALAINTIILLLFEFVPKIISAYEEQIVLSILFVLGLALAYLPVPEQVQKITHLQGHLLHGITALFLTYHYSIIFAIAYLIFLLYLVNKGSLISIAIICALILRYYIDFSFGFLPKSLVFIIAGIILIGFGFFFEHQRKKGETNHEE